MKKEQLFIKILAIAFTIVGVICFIAAGVVKVKNDEFAETAETITATIDEIDYYRSGDENHEDVYLTYEFHGKEYNHVHVNFYSSDMYEDQEIQVLINPDEPGDIHPTFDWIFTLIPIGMGAIFLIIGVIMCIVIFGGERKNKKLLESGKHLRATVDRIHVDDDVTVNGRHPYQIYCTYNDEVSGLIYKFKSGDLYFDPTECYKQGDYIDVYVDPDNYKKYYVDAANRMEGRVMDYT